MFICCSDYQFLLDGGHPLSVDEEDAVQPGGMVHGEPQHDVGPGPVPQSNDLLHPQTVQDGDEVQPDGLHAGEGVVAGQVLGLGFLAGQRDVEKERPSADILHVVPSSELQPGAEGGSRGVDRQEDHGVPELVQVPLDVDSEGTNNVHVDHMGSSLQVGPCHHWESEISAARNVFIKDIKQKLSSSGAI